MQEVLRSESGGGSLGALSLEARGLLKSYSGRRVVDGVDLIVRSGEVVGLLGPNGAGKTTTFYMVVGLVKPDGGSVFLGDIDITPKPMYARALSGVSYLPQEASVFRKLTVRENILSVLEILPSYVGKRSKQLERTDELIAELQLEKVENSRAYSLSGGERRRVEIARALATSPKFMLLDEPFAGIDPLVVAELQQIVRALKNQGIGILITDHNVRETLGICDRSYILSNGKVLVSGTSDEVANSEIARRYYLGEGFTF
ncbi:MAG TPA: LPS export ABC transporter ATP-binding protein [Oligoflexia bacterium]|nr:LPS export ABC transporter ATP-binding protein [Oligoflexia bacterium]HMP49324.1 LPS export ABC transporter ATP-binding protein [Oligoflexia bacterium]